jgi:hypothetical protein
MSAATRRTRSSRRVADRSSRRPDIAGPTFGDPRDIPIDLLHGRASEIAEPGRRGAERAAASTYRALREWGGRTANRPEETLLAEGPEGWPEIGLPEH